MGRCFWGVQLPGPRFTSVFAPLPGLTALFTLRSGPARGPVLPASQQADFQPGETRRGASGVNASQPFPFCCPSSRGPAFSGFLGPTLSPGFFLVGPLQVPPPTFRLLSQELGHAPVRTDHTPGLSLTARYPLFWFSEGQALLRHARCFSFFLCCKVSPSTFIPHPFAYNPAL